MIVISSARRLIMLHENISIIRYAGFYVSEASSENTVSESKQGGSIGCGITGMGDWAGEIGSFDVDASGGCAAGLFSNAHTVILVLFEF